MRSRKIEIQIPVGTVKLGAALTVPEKANSLVIFSHGSGSSRFSPRNNFVARVLNAHGIATLLTDLLTQQEDEDYMKRFNIALLTKRLVAVTYHLFNDKKFEHFTVGYFGASTGAASALNAAAEFGELISAVVSRGGRPDLAHEHLSEVTAPTLLLVGGLDEPVIRFNEEAMELLHCEKEMKIIPGASHLFEEAGKLEEVADLVAEWFEEHLVHSKKKVLIH